MDLDLATTDRPRPPRRARHGCRGRRLREPAAGRRRRGRQQQHGRARAPAVDGGAELGDGGGGELRAGGRRPAAQAALPPRGARVPRAGGVRHGGAEGAHVPVAGHVLPRQRPAPAAPPSGGRRRRRQGRRRRSSGGAAAVRAVQRLRRARRGGGLRRHRGAVAGGGGGARRPLQGAGLRQGDRAGALLLAAALRAGICIYRAK